MPRRARRGSPARPRRRGSGTRVAARRRRSSTSTILAKRRESRSWDRSSRRRDVRSGIRLKLVGLLRLVVGLVDLGRDPLLVVEVGVDGGAVLLQRGADLGGQQVVRAGFVGRELGCAFGVG